MATLFLAAGASWLIGGLGIGGTIAATVLSAGAYLAGGAIDSYLVSSFTSSSSNASSSGASSRIQDVQVTTSTEGAYINKQYGRMKIGGTIIWATKYREVVETETYKAGKFGEKIEQKSYTYFQSFAIGLCEGPILGIGRIWADGTEMKLKKVNWRLYKGTESQGRDPKIEAVEGADFTPAYRGLSYIVFEELELTDYYNHMPQITVEVFSLPSLNENSLENRIPGWCFIPGSGEFVYSTRNIWGAWNGGATYSFTIHSNTKVADVLIALDQMESFAPGTKTVALVVSWLGTDLRVGECQVLPKVEQFFKPTLPLGWTVSGVPRILAQRVSILDGRPAVGGTPTDWSVYEIIQELKSRGYFVIFYPFVMMDIPAGNGLPDPYGGSEQAAFPWRGRITCHPAPGMPGSPDQTSATTADVEHFFGECVPSDFSAYFLWTIIYSGPAGEWSFRRMILHYAKLCQQAGGVDGFIIGSELVGLNKIRDSATHYVAPDLFAALADDVRSIVGSGTKIAYSANWSEWHHHDPADGSGDLFFHLDAIWSAPNIDFIGIDWYAPCTDWRDTADHLDSLEGWDSIYNRDYIKSRVQAGEDYDWFYASQADRDNQVRTPITDATYGKPWVWRTKDIFNWWNNAHYNRPGGTESGTATAWVPKSKPIWFIEVGCPAVDKGPNQPNVFVDPKSSESFYPRYSNGNRDDLVQHQYLQAFLDYWLDNSNNPSSTEYAGRMVTTDRMCVWAFDARPYPYWPNDSTEWVDGDLWWLGHWVSGRLGQVPLDEFVTDLIEPFNIEVDTEHLYGLVRGYQLTSVTSVRDILNTLQVAYFFDVFESEGKIKFVQKGQTPKAYFIEENLVRQSSNDTFPTFKLTRSQETDLPQVSVIKYYDETKDYTQATARASRLIGSSLRASESSIAIVLNLAESQAVADTTLMDAWVMREKLEARLAPSALAFDPSDVLLFGLNGREFQVRIEQIGYEYDRPFSGVRTDPTIYQAPQGTKSVSRGSHDQQSAGITALFMDMTLLAYPNNPYGPYIAAFAQPWPGANIYRSYTSSNFALDTTIQASSYIGTLTGVNDLSADTGSGAPAMGNLEAGPYGVIDYKHELLLTFGSSPGLSSIDEETFFSSSTNTIAIQNPDNENEWEVIHFQEVEMVSGTSYKIRKLIRGILGTEHVATVAPIPLEATVVLLSATMDQSTLGGADRGVTLNWKFGPADLPIDDETYQETQFTSLAKGLRPFSPSHLRMLPGSVGDNVVFEWMRRTRVNASNSGYSFDAEPPLNETSERYRITIYDGSTVKRTTTVTSPTFTYTESMQEADWGTVQDEYDVGVAQISEIYGPGIETRHILDIWARP